MTEPKTEDTPANSLLDYAGQDPYDFYDHIRSNGGVVWDERLNGWLVASYELCKFIETREDLFRHAYADASATVVKVKGGRRNVTILTGEEHLRMHRFMAQLFSPVAMKEHRVNHVRPVLDFLIGRIERNGKAELASLFDQLSSRVILSLLSMPWQDDAVNLRQIELNRRVFTWIGHVDRSDAGTRSAIDASQQLSEMLLPYVRRGRDNPGEDLVSRIWTEVPKILNDFTEEDAVVTCRELYLAGSDTTGLALGNTFWKLLTDQELRERVLMERGKTTENLVEEMLRLFNPVHYRFRVANQDYELGRVRIAKDDLVIPVNAAANRDPDRYHAPKDVDLNRPDLRSHLAFNAGPRVCIGAPLARAELYEAIDTMFDRLPGLRLDPDAEPPKIGSTQLRSYRPLNVVFDVP